MKVSFVTRFRHRIARLPVIVLCVVPVAVAVVYFAHRYPLKAAAPVDSAATSTVNGLTRPR